MKQKTAVQFLFEEMERMQYFIGNDLYNAYKQALEKEKEQIMDAYWNGNSDGHVGENYLTDYYDFTYKQD